jgi:hypothetical protein
VLSAHAAQVIRRCTLYDRRLEAEPIAHLSRDDREHPRQADGFQR